MYYIRTGDSYRQLTAKTLRGAKRQATQAGCNKVYEVCNSKLIDSRTGKVINMLLCVSRKGGMYTYRTVVLLIWLRTYGATARIF